MFDTDRVLVRNRMGLVTGLVAVWICALLYPPPPLCIVIALA